jgi:hypothetical protein
MVIPSHQEDLAGLLAACLVLTGSYCVQERQELDMLRKVSKSNGCRTAGLWSWPYYSTLGVPENDAAGRAMRTIATGRTTPVVANSWLRWDIVRC